MKFKDYLRQAPRDFFHSLITAPKMRDGYPQGYGFHHHVHHENEHRGTYATQQIRGKVYKVPSDGSCCYRCVMDGDVIIDQDAHFHEVLEAVKVSAPHFWQYVGSLSNFNDHADPCFTVVPGDECVNIHVKPDGHSSLTT